MKAGDLIIDNDYPTECGLVLKISQVPGIRFKYFILCTDGKPRWFTTKEIEGRCEVISASR